MELQRKLSLARRQIQALTKQQQTMEQNLQHLFGKDQLYFLKHASMKGTKWETQTVRRALQLYLSCGRGGYECLRNQGYPLPCIRTLQKRMESFKFDAGILEDVFPLLKSKIGCMKPEERHGVLLIDEMAIKPGLEFDPSTEKVIGVVGCTYL